MNNNIVQIENLSYVKAPAVCMYMQLFLYKMDTAS